jgi:hypothetical protein
MRRLTAALLLLNLVLLTWLLLGDFTGQSEREPGRVKQQVNPDAVHVLPADAASAVLAPNAPALLAQDGVPGDAASAVAVSVASPSALAAPAASAVPAGLGASTVASGLGAAAGAVTAMNAVCLEAGPFTADTLPAAEAALAAELPKGSWQRLVLQPAPAYLVYLGRFADQKTAQRRLQEIRKRGVQADLARDLPGLEPGLVFSRHAQAAQAEAALAALLAAQGPRQARVVPASEAAAVMLRVEHPTDEVRSQIAGMEPTATLRGGFRGCRKGTGKGTGKG